MATQFRYDARAQARLDVVDWIEGFYNHRRLRLSMGYRAPAHLERGGPTQLNRDYRIVSG